MYEERHVVPSQGGWKVTRTGGQQRPALRHATPRAAVRRARAALQDEGGDLVIHGRDGEVHARITYPPRGA
jgi:hypothetical protein